MRRSVTSRLIFWIAGTTALLFSSASLYAYRIARNQAVADAERQAVLIAESQAIQVREALNSAEEGARLLATTLGHTSASNAELEKVVRAFVGGNRRVYGSTIAANPAKRGRYAPYFYRAPAGIARADLATAAYDYPNKEWYTSAAGARAPRWSRPYFDEGGGNVLMATYTVPVFTEARKDNFEGVVTADIALEWLAELIASESIRDFGYAMVLSSRGDVFAHPEAGVLRTTIAALQKNESAIDPRAEAVVARMLRREEAFEPFEDPYLGTRVRAVFRPVGGADWFIAVVYSEDRLLAGARRLARLNAVILVAVLGALGAVVAAVSRRVTRPLRDLSAGAARMATGDLEAPLPAVASGDEVGTLTAAFHHMRDSLREYIRNLEITTKERERQESELKIARTIQMQMLPPDRIEAGSPGAFQLAASLAPARRVGGDLYDHFLFGRQLWFLVGDVSGKGVGAALFMARAMTMIRASVHPGIGPKQMLQQVNRGLCERNDAAIFVTLFAGMLDLDSGVLRYGTAGHDPPVLVSDTGADFLNTEGGPPLGLIEDAEYGEERWVWAPGNTLVLYTDGVTEAMDGEAGLFTGHRVLETLRLGSPPTPGEAIGLLLEAVRNFAGSTPQSDDITLLAVRYGPAAPGRSNA